jgi:hypothetical protein
MGVDHAGHSHGARSNQYAEAAGLQDDILATLVPLWLEGGYRVLVTSDHGHTAEGGHGGTEPEVTDTPLYLIDPRGGRGDLDEAVDNTAVAATVWQWLGLEGTPADAGRPIDL